MSKKYLLISIGIIVIVIFSICIKCGKNDLPTTSMMDAERILQEYLKSANQWEEEYSLEPTDPVVGEIDNNEVYRFEVRYKENVEEVGKYSLQGTTQSRYLTGGVPPVRFSM